MVILVVFKVFLVVKNLEILIQIVPDSPIYYYFLRRLYEDVLDTNVSLRISGDKPW